MVKSHWLLKWRVAASAELLPTFQKHRQGIGLQLAENPDYKDVEVQPDDGDPLHVVGLVVSVNFNL